LIVLHLLGLRYLSMPRGSERAAYLCWSQAATRQSAFRVASGRDDTPSRWSHASGVVA